MADAKGEQTLDEPQIPPHPLKRKPDAESAVDAVAAPAVEPKKQKVPAEEAGAGGQVDHQKEERHEEEEAKDDGVSSNGKAGVDKEKGVLTPADKGKGKMVAEVDEDEQDDDDDDSDGSDDGDSDDDSGDVVVGEGDYESDFEDDPLAEVDLSNILPSRTRRQGPPPPGAYLVNDLDDDEEEDDDDDEVCG